MVCHNCVSNWSYFTGCWALLFFLVFWVGDKTPRKYLLTPCLCPCDWVTTLFYPAQSKVELSMLPSNNFQLPMLSLLGKRIKIKKEANWKKKKEKDPGMFQTLFLMVSDIQSCATVLVWEVHVYHLRRNSRDDTHYLTSLAFPFCIIYFTLFLHVLKIQNWWKLPPYIHFLQLRLLFCQIWAWSFFHSLFNAL